MHVTRRVGSILLRAISIVVLTPTIRTKTGSKTSTAATLSMPSVVWLVENSVNTIWILISALPFVEALFVTIRARKSEIQLSSSPWSMPVPWVPLCSTSPAAFVI